MWNKNFLTKLRALSEFIIGFGLGYFAFSLPLNPVIDFIMILVAIFVLFQGLGDVDKINGYGQANKHNDNT